MHVYIHQPVVYAVHMYMIYGICKDGTYVYVVYVNSSIYLHIYCENHASSQPTPINVASIPRTLMLP